MTSAQSNHAIAHDCSEIHRTLRKEKHSLYMPHNLSRIGSSIFTLKMSAVVILAQTLEPVSPTFSGSSNLSASADCGLVLHRSQLHHNRLFQQADSFPGEQNVPSSFLA